MKNKKQGLGVERFIVILIAICMIFLIGFANRKLDEIITSDREALLMEHQEGDPIHEELAQKILDFRPDACKMIEVFSDSFEPILRVQFRENDEHMQNSLNDHPELVNLFKSHENGHTCITINNEEEDIYFRWTSTTSGERCLFIIYMSRPVVKNIWVFSAICYIVLILVFTLFARLQLKSHAEKIKLYDNMSRYYD